jgi:hypothetical protein
MDERDTAIYARRPSSATPGEALHGCSVITCCKRLHDLPVDRSGAYVPHSALSAARPRTKRAVVVASHSHAPTFGPSLALVLVARLVA